MPDDKTALVRNPETMKTTAIVVSTPDAVVGEFDAGKLGKAPIQQSQLARAAVKLAGSIKRHEMVIESIVEDILAGYPYSRVPERYRFDVERTLLRDGHITLEDLAKLPQGK